MDRNKLLMQNLNFMLKERISENQFHFLLDEKIDARFQQLRLIDIQSITFEYYDEYEASKFNTFINTFQIGENTVRVNAIRNKKGRISEEVFKSDTYDIVTGSGDNPHFHTVDYFEDPDTADYGIPELLNAINYSQNFFEIYNSVNPIKESA